MDIYGYSYGYANQYRRAARLPQKHPLTGEACELNGAQVSRGRLSLLDLAVQVFELAQRMGGFSMAALSKRQAQTAIWEKAFADAGIGQPVWACRRLARWDSRV